MTILDNISERPGLKVYADMEQHSDEWFEVRRGIITASVVGQLITPSTVKSASNDNSRSLVWELVAQRITGFVYPTFTSDDMARGHLAEIVARDWYSAEHAPVTQVGFMRLDAEWGSLGYSPDGLVGDDGLIEVKSPRHKGHLEAVVRGVVPLGYMAQIQAGLLVSGRKWCDLISWPGGMAPHVARVEPDEEWRVAIMAAVKDFERQARHVADIYNQRTKGAPIPALIGGYSEIVI